MGAMVGVGALLAVVGSVGLVATLPYLLARAVARERSACLDAGEALGGLVERAAAARLDVARSARRAAALRLRLATAPPRPPAGPDATT